MNFRMILSVLAGACLAATPAFAKDEAPPPEPQLSSFVSTDILQDPQNVLFLQLSNGGKVTIRLMPQWAPNHVERIKTLVQRGFYDGLTFHRVIDGFMAQTGDPTGTGAGGSDLPDMKAEFNAMPHVRGAVSAARTNDPDSANSQFFIVFYPRFALDRKYTVFGRVIGGMDVVDQIQRGEPPANPTKIVHAWLETSNAPATAPLAGTVPAPAPAATGDAGTDAPAAAPPSDTVATPESAEAVDAGT